MSLGVGLAAAVMVATAQAPPKVESPEVARLARFFVSACLHGAVRLPPGTRLATPAEFEQPEKGEHQTIGYKLREPMTSLLRISEFDAAYWRGWSKVCRVDAHIHSVKSAWQVISSEVIDGGLPFDGSRDAYILDYPAAGYEITVCRQFMLITHYTDEAAKKQLAANGSPKPIFRAYNWNLQ